MNNFNISGEILKFGIKGTQYPKLWIQAQLASPKELDIEHNRFFINFDIDPNPNSKKGKVAEYIKSKLQNCSFFFLSEAMITQIKLSKKVGDTWETEETTGVKANINNLVLASNRFEPINVGLCKGKVTAYTYTESTQYSKIMLEERYRNPLNNEYKSRHIPILYKGSFGFDITNSFLFTYNMLCGTTPSKESKVYALAKKVVVCDG